MRHTFSDIYNPDEVEERTAEEQMKERLIKRIGGDNEQEKTKARTLRIHSQIRKCMLMGKKKYYYAKKDKKIINDFIKENGNVMEFIQEED